MDNFNITLENNLFSDEGSNFGNPPHKTVFVLDSVIYLSPNSAVLVRKEYHYPWSKKIKDTGELMRIKRDTLQNDLLFSNKHGLDSIKRVLKTGYYKETHEAKKTVFVGYDNKRPKEKKKDLFKNSNPSKEKQVSPFISTGNDTINNSPFDTAMLKALAGIFFLALLGAWLSTKFYNLRLQKA